MGDTGVLPCAHAFCFICIQEWGKASNNCPNCRARFNTISCIGTGENGELVTKEVMVEDATLRVETPFDPLDVDSEEESEEDSEEDSEYTNSSDEDSESDEDDEPTKKRRRVSDEEEHKGEESKSEEEEELVDGLIADHNNRVALASLKDLIRTETTFYCAAEGCGKAFKRKADLERHLLIHLGIKNFACDQCGTRFTRKGDLTVHLRSHVKEEDKRFVCDVPGCGKTYTLRNNLTRHKKAAHEGKRHTCQFCKKGFTQTGDLNRHMRIHNDVRPFECTACGMKFKQKAHLKQHEKTHKAK